jgi:hypothetical protein
MENSGREAQQVNEVRHLMSVRFIRFAYTPQPVVHIFPT